MVNVLKRFRVTKDCRTGKYVILDRRKLNTPIRDNRLTKEYFDTAEQAEGFVFGKFGQNALYLTVSKYDVLNTMDKAFKYGEKVQGPELGAAFAITAHALMKGQVKNAVDSLCSPKISGGTTYRVTENGPEKVK